MHDKPLTGDEEQRRNDTRASRFQSGLPPEPDDPGVAETGSGDPENADAAGRTRPTDRSGTAGAPTDQAGDS